MGWDNNGQLIPKDIGICSCNCRVCLEVCPFLEHNKDEAVLGSEIFGEDTSSSLILGRYQNCYVGYANETFRENGASGGLATWFLTYVLEAKMVDYVICVRSRYGSKHLFEYSILSSSASLFSSAKSVYYPVELSSVILHVITNPGKYVLIGLPCFVKAVRLASSRIPLLKRRISIVAGLVCGQTKCSFFTEYLIHQSGLNPNDVFEVSYRNKRSDQPADNYVMKAKDKNGNSSSIFFQGVYGSTWGSGAFSPRACSFCDDVFAELADITFMDAWLPEYNRDPKGTNLILTRSILADRIINQGITASQIHVSRVSPEKIEDSQLFVSRRKRRDLSWRLWLALHDGKSVTRKRVPPLRPPFAQALRQGFWNPYATIAFQHGRNAKAIHN
jgi:coenzyme F420-reducing hydrogenase beta subunit